MKFDHFAYLAFASTSLAAPAFTFPGFTFPGLSPKKTTTTSASTSVKASVAPTSTAVITTALSTVVSPTTSSIPAKTSSAAAAPSQSGCTYQGTGGGSTESGVLNGNCCTDVTIVFARGTGESGNVGTVAGPPMFKSLRNKLGAGRVTIQGVDYPADSAGNSQLGASGGPTMAADVKQALAQCPSTKIVVSGYSQGGMVVHNAFSSQGLSSAQVSAAILFGDPFNGQAVGNLSSGKVDEFCADGDDVCNGSGSYTITQAHLSYGSNADAAADFIISALGL